MTITAITIVSASDSADLLSGSLLSYVDKVDETIVGDNGMTDTQRKIVLQYKVKIVPVSNVAFADLVREDLHKLAESEHILVVDPDEVVSRSLFSTLIKYGTEYDYVRIPRRNIIFGKWIEHSRWWPDYQLRFFKKGSVKWKRELHPIPVAKGNGFDLPMTEKNSLIHYNYENIDHYVSKMMRYAKSEAKARVKDEGYSMKTAIKDSLDEFISRYYFAKGYKDGMHGFVLSFLQMTNVWLVYFYCWELKKYETDDVAKAELIGAPVAFFSQGLKSTMFWVTHEKLPTQLSTAKRKLLNFLLR